MTSYIFDSDHATFLVKRKGPDFAMLSLRIAEHAEDMFHFGVVTFHEGVTGAHAKINASRKDPEIEAGYSLLMSIQQAYSQAPMIAYDAAASRKFHSIEHLRSKVGVMDLRIAAIALANDMTLLTRNVRDFSKIPGLKFEDWTV